MLVCVAYGICSMMYTFMHTCHRFAIWKHNITSSWKETKKSNVLGKVIKHYHNVYLVTADYASEVSPASLFTGWLSGGDDRKPYHERFEMCC